MILTSNLKMYRAKFSKSQSNMAELLEISTISYRQKEKGKRSFTLDEAKKISDLFKLPIESIFFDENVHEKGTTA